MPESKLTPVTAPATAAGTRLCCEASVEAESALDRYDARILQLLEQPLSLAPGTRNEIQPRVLALAPDATRMWANFADHIEKEIAPGRAFAAIRAVANKLPEQAARIAGVLTLTDDLDAVVVTADALECGIALAQHFAGEAMRLNEGAHVSQHVRAAQRLLTWLHTSWPEPLVSLPDIYQRGPGTIREASTAKRLVGILEDHGWLVKAEGVAIVRGIRRRDAWHVVPEAAR